MKKGRQALEEISNGVALSSNRPLQKNPEKTSTREGNCKSKSRLSPRKVIQNWKDVKPKVNSYWNSEDMKSIMHNKQKVIMKPCGLPPVAENDSKKNVLMEKKLEEITKKIADIDYKSKTKQDQAAVKQEQAKVKQDKATVKQDQTTTNHQVAVKTQGTLELNTFFPVNEVPSKSSKDLNQVLEKDSKQFLLTEYANDIFLYLTQLDIKYKIKKNHLNDQIEITPKMRAILFDWINDIHKQLHLLIETYYLTVKLVDKYLEIVPDVRKNNLQLVGSAALLIATKYEELIPPQVSDISYAAENTYTEEEILAMERKMLIAFEFALGHPSPIQFLRFFATVAEVFETQYAAAKYFIELATLEYTLAHYPAKQMAAAALYMSLTIFRHPSQASLNNTWKLKIEKCTEYKIDELKPIVKIIAKLVLDAPKSRLQSIYKKYRLKKNDFVAAKLEYFTPKINLLTTC